MQQTEKNPTSNNSNNQGLPPGGPGGPAAPEKRKPPKMLIGVIGVAAVLGLILGTKWLLHHMAYVSTDDAQVAGDIATVSARVPGHVAQLFVDEGQNVTKGEVLAKLDDTDYKAQLQQAQAALALAQSNMNTSQTGVSFQSQQTTAQIGQAKAGVAAAQAGLASAEANAAKSSADFRRLNRLFREGAISQQQYDAARTAAEAGNAGVAAAESQVNAAQQALNLAQAGTQAVQIKKGGVETTAAQVQQASAAVDLAQLQLGYTTITAPANGFIARRSVNIGEQVQPGQGLFSLAETDHVWVVANVEETNIRRVHLGAPVDVSIDAFPHQSFTGHVAFVNAVTGAQFSLLPENNSSGNFTKVVQRIPVKIEVDDPNHQLKPGMSAVVDIKATDH
ncbi:MAG TPA: HlyD family secretion protein [Oscillatoriaceae cyanobacterium]